LGDQNIELVLKTGSTTTTSSQLPLTSGYLEYQHTVLKNPETTSNWSISELNNVQIGFKLPNA
jgi:hypothetical protein